MKNSLILLLALIASQAQAQEWAVGVFTQDGAMGSGSVVYVDSVVDGEGWKVGLIVTADHVVENGDTGIRLSFEDGQQSDNAIVVARDRQKDIAVILGKVPGAVDAVKIAERDIKEGDEINFVGRGRRKFTGKASPLCYPGEAWSDAVAMPGDSGGAALLDGKLAGVISGGLRWAPGKPVRTWPCRTCNTDAINKIIKRAKKEAVETSGVTTKREIKSYEPGDLKTPGVKQLIIFSATWCTPCKRLKADIEKYLSDIDVDRIVFVDVDQEPELANSNGVNAYPTVMLVRDSSIITRITGPSIEGLIAIAKKYK